MVKTPLSKRKPWPVSAAASPSSLGASIIICIIRAGAMASLAGSPVSCPDADPALAAASAANTAATIAAIP